ncbi:MAG: hypothetical protein HY822_21190 [Acidobacteria bacterium]|nr:hypothetical protein [Acidobacteriota bacterium]
MKKLMSILLGLSLVIGTASMVFGQEKKEEKKETKKKGKKTKKTAEEKK